MTVGWDARAGEGIAGGSVHLDVWMRMNLGAVQRRGAVLVGGCSGMRKGCK